MFVPVTWLTVDISTDHRYSFYTCGEFDPHSNFKQFESECMKSANQNAAFHCALWSFQLSTEWRLYPSTSVFKTHVNDVWLKRWSTKMKKKNPIYWPYFKLWDNLKQTFNMGGGGGGLPPNTCLTNSTKHPHPVCVSQITQNIILPSACLA
jgi:hypothetical protein